jgi:hypothetical protein
MEGMTLSTDTMSGVGAAATAVMNSAEKKEAAEPLTRSQKNLEAARAQ